ncbi:hypothetical protein L0P88_05465 [Muricauda sp. SCSIO 64092]|uniref:hypothetical protein n=1 Tax=Allomuricauda sp. SCSIO 64092 TaxID=2908842 RepID=UPI001FF1CA15|nr:hypothetical protein [Muricauda sp. SCSIO 64092]UOY08000.1 hypothetical protein L0P88_05465 [Muricauda sp. SCSIO 64092]
MKTMQFAVMCCILFFGQNSWSQRPVTLSIFNESTAVPYDHLITAPIHPGIQIGTEFHWKESKHFRLYPSISIGYMFHRKLFQGVYANLELGLDYKTSFGLNLKSKIGLGYLHTFSTQQEFQFDNGGYRSGRDKGNSRLMPSFTTGLGYRFNPKKNDSSELFLLYQSWLEYPYSPGFIPLMAHTNLHLGLKFYPFEKNER